MCDLERFHSGEKVHLMCVSENRESEPRRLQLAGRNSARVIWRRRASVWLVLLVGLSGCGSSDSKRIPLTGKVTQGGQPVKIGAISLTPADGHNGVAANTAVKDGSYQFTREDGPDSGPYKVTISVSLTKDELMKRRQEPAAPQTQWEFQIKVPQSGAAAEDFRLETK